MFRRHPSEQKLLERTIAAVQVRRTHRPGRPRSKPGRLILDRGCDSNELRAKLAKRDIDPIIPAQKNHPNVTHQDGRKLRRYRRRWIVERPFAWLGWSRRLLVRHERLLSVYAASFLLACAGLTLRQVTK